MSFLFAIVLSQAVAAPVDCGKAITQMDMNRCAGDDFAAADAALNAQWEVTAADMRERDALTQSLDDGRPGYFAQLLAAQRAWLAFRDAHCASAGYAARGGSMEPMLVAMCRTQLTRQRTSQLQDLIEP